MKRKLLFALISAAMVSSMILGGCGAKEEPAQAANEPVKETTVEEPAEEPSEVTEEPAPEEGQEGNIEEEGGRGDYISFCPYLDITKKGDDILDGDGNWVIESYYPEILVQSAYVDTSVLQETIDSSCQYYQDCVNDRVNEIKEMLDEEDELLTSLERSPEFPLASATVDVFPTRVDENIISLGEFYYFFAGGSHPSYEYDGLVIDTNSGKELFIEDVLKDVDGFASYAVDKAFEEIGDFENRGVEFFEDYEEAINNIMGHRWYFSGAGLEFIYNPEEIAPYAVGMISFIMPYEEILSYLADNYIPNLEDGFLVMPINCPVQATVIDGMMVTVENNEAEGTAILSAGDISKTVSGDGRFIQAYLFKRTQKQYVFANYVDNGRLNFSVFDVTGGDVKEIYSQSDVGFRRETLSEETVTLYSSVDEDYEEVVSIETIIPFE